jgi:hypothetical protein
MASEGKPLSSLEKTCKRCHESKSFSQFNKEKRRSDGFHGECRPCQRIRWKARPKNSTEQCRERHLKEYGLTHETFKELFEKQDGKCAICKTSSFSGRSVHPHVDHDHSTGRVRGLLCSNCNTALGKFRDSRDMLRAAIQYLERAG